MSNALESSARFRVTEIGVRVYTFVGVPWVNQNFLHFYYLAYGLGKAWNFAYVKISSLLISGVRSWKSMWNFAYIKISSVLISGVWSLVFVFASEWSLLSGIKEEDGIIWTLFPQSGHGSVEFI
jgi:hypothetical protein